MLELKVWLRVMLLLCLPPLVARAQIDPVKRELLQLGYNAAIEGHSPFSGYAFFAILVAALGGAYFYYRFTR